MRKIFGSLVVFLLSATLSFAEGNSGQNNKHDDFDDDRPIQVGWAVITPAAGATSSSTNGMVVFASFGKNNGSDTTQAGIFPPALTTNTILFVNSSGRLSRNLGVAIVNPGSSSTNVTMTLRREDGTLLATKTIQVASHHQESKFVTELFSGQSAVPSDLTGTLTITSTSPISVIGLRFRGANFSTLPVTSLSTPGTMPAITTEIGGAGALLLPQFATGGGWATEIDIVNTGTTSLIVCIDLFKPDGSALTATLNRQTASSFTNLTIPAGGVLTVSPRDNNGDSRF